MNKKPKKPQSTDQVQVCQTTARPIYWEKADGAIWGPARPEFVAREGEEPKASFWVVAQFKGAPVWIRSDVLRSKRDFETQVRLMPVELIREPR